MARGELPGCAMIQFVIIALLVGALLWGMFYDSDFRARYHREGLSPRPAATVR